jgi:peptidoglycan L-alanyl-D-glutamate endopeptidase CwlK
MPSFSLISKVRLQSCNPLLQRLFNDVIQTRDCAILVGERNQCDQDAACASGKSRAPWPTSKHNCSPSRAVDVAPFPIDWDDIKRFREFADFVKERAAALGISVRWGGDFKTIGDFDHWELTDNGIGGSDGTGSSNA